MQRTCTNYQEEIDAERYFSPFDASAAMILSLRKYSTAFTSCLVTFSMLFTFSASERVKLLEMSSSFPISALSTWKTSYGKHGSAMRGLFQEQPQGQERAGETDMKRWRSPHSRFLIGAFFGFLLTFFASSLSQATSTFTLPLIRANSDMMKRSCFSDAE